MFILVSLSLSTYVFNDLVKQQTQRIHYGILSSSLPFGDSFYLFKFNSMLCIFDLLFIIRKIIKAVKLKNSL